jgi:hypothetical protein
MRDGLYRVHFKTHRGEGSGVVALLDGKLRGGDGGLYYVGNLTSSDGQLRAEITTGKHTQIPGVVSVFGADAVDLVLEGESGDTSANVTGHTKEAPGDTFQASLTRIAD